MAVEMNKNMKTLPEMTLNPCRSSQSKNQLNNFTNRDEENNDNVLANENTNISPQKTQMINKPIVVKNCKQLVEIAAETKQENNKKDPILVIIDTNMLTELINLPIAVSVQSNPLGDAMNITQPINKSIQNSFNQIQNSQTTIKNLISTTKTTHVIAPKNVPEPPIISSTLTDDMVVVETPSFNVPFVYEKPPKQSIKEFIDNTIKIKITKGDENENQYEESLDKKNENNQKEKTNEKLDTNGKINFNESGNEVPGYEKKLDGSKKNSDEQMFVDESERSKKIDSKSKNVSEITDLKNIYSITNLTVDSDKNEIENQSLNYFETPLGNFFMQIGINLVQKHVQRDLLCTLRRKKDRKGNKCPKVIHIPNNSLIKTLEISKKNNDQFDLKICELCDFKSDSNLVMAHHLDTSHNITAYYCYISNVSTFQVGSPHEIVQHMDTHNIKSYSEKSPALHKCPNCPFEVNKKGILNRHLNFCLERHQPKINQAPPLDWEPPAKVPRILQNNKPLMSSSLDHFVYQAIMSRFKQFYNFNIQQLQQQQYNKIINVSNVGTHGQTILPRQQPTSEGILLKNTSIKPTNQPNLIFTPYSMNNHANQKNSNCSKSVQQATASITYIPLSFPSSQSSSTLTNNNKKSTFVICEICDDYIIDLKKFRKHLQFIHKVKIHPKLVFNRPIISCPKCQFKYFTDKGLERHLLGSHGLVTSRLQKAAIRGKDGGRCPVCNRDFLCELLNHISHDHSISLNPIILSYKCIHCTSKFCTHKRFENHVYSKHTNVAKNLNKKSLNNQPISSSTSITSTPKPSKINDEITIISQTPKI